ncbi:hypothetical protein NM208_g10109 [Fusarium decemcellulare]|uniref:Uncharacterized protein n=1 Tax=Fusarium decemcellulare TaxID=57161 RepID=A0ACC1RZ25_9HYPO|nr:hypothetical protein NM208_g10109 [Fusarium decemcellulare]
MAPSEFQIRLQKGMTFYGTDNKLQLADTTLQASLAALLRLPHLSSSLYQLTAATLSRFWSRGLETPISRQRQWRQQIMRVVIDELRGILKDLPTEQPPGSEDIYGLDTGIVWASNDDDGWVWTNGGPQGCGGGESFVHASADQKAQFARAVDIVYEIANP